MFTLDGIWVAGPHQGAFQGEDATALERMIDDSLSQLGVVHGSALVLERLLGCE